MGETAIQVDGVWKKFRKGEFHDSLRELIPAAAKRLIGRGPRRDELADREFWALRDVSFQVERGQSLGIIGPNGAGKSTMLKLLSRIIKPNRGTYEVRGRVSALIEVGAGFHQDLTGRENIYLNGTILGMRRREIKAKEEQIIEFAGVRDFIDTPIKRYSSGMKARLGFAVAAHMDPDILLVDEVLSVGDARFRARCINRMKSLIRSDVTVVFISHILEQVRQLCPATVVLDKGTEVYYGETDGAIKTYLDLLSADLSTKSDARAQITNVRLVDAAGNETTEWTVDEPGILEFDLSVTHPFIETMVGINFKTLSGVYLGTANSQRQGLTLPGEPGVRTVRLSVDDVPLTAGDYALEFQVFVWEQAGEPTVEWASDQPVTLSVRGGDAMGQLVDLRAQWEIVSTSPAAAVAGN